MNLLLQQMRSDPTSHTPLSLPDLIAVLQGPNILILVIRDKGSIIGTGTIIWNEILTDTFAFLEDIVVDSTYRGQGLGEKITRALIDVARDKKVKTIALTSRPSRVAANKLYQKLGFNVKETNYYEMDL